MFLIDCCGDWVSLELNYPGCGFFICSYWLALLLQLCQGCARVFTTYPYQIRIDIFNLALKYVYSFSGFYYGYTERELTHYINHWVGDCVLFLWNTLLYLPFLFDAMTSCDLSEPARWNAGQTDDCKWRFGIKWVNILPAR